MLFELPRFEYKNAMDMQEAVACLSQYGNRARVIAGATDLLVL
jgi:CO/xanthine dehydrogenase FAD-binding subunit